jgi:RNA polymerase sigma-70 factor, ECF subfamily
MSAAEVEFEEQRPGLARLAYRMLGSLTDADDVVQEATCAGCVRTRPR